MIKQIGSRSRQLLTSFAAATSLACASSSLAQDGAGWEGTYVGCFGRAYEGQCSSPADLYGAISIAAGYAHSAAVRSDGSVACWGFNYYGQCDVPANLGPVNRVAAGYLHTVALNGSGVVRCWGFNGNGQCDVPAELGASIAVSAGVGHTVALIADGTIRCWGEASVCAVPSDLASVAAISAGQFHTMALQTDGKVVCWGLNYQGQCDVPAKLGAVVAIGAGASAEHSIAVRADGSIRCWGRNDHGQCNAPVGLSGVTAAGGGYFFSVALRTDGTVVAWGGNDYGELDIPQGVDHVAALAIGNMHSVTLQNKIWDVRALPPVGSGYALFPNLAAAVANTPTNWLLESSSMPQPGFRATARTIQGSGSLTISGDVDLVSGSSVTAAGQLIVGGIAHSDASSVLRSNLVTTGAPAVQVQRLSPTAPSLRVIAPSSTLVVEPIDVIAGGPSITPDISCTHRLVLAGGVRSSAPSVNTAFTVLEACTDPSNAAVTPSIEFAASSAIELPVGNKIITHAPTTTLLAGTTTLYGGTIETDSDLAISGPARIPAGSSVALSLDRIRSTSPAFEIRDGGELFLENGSSLQSNAPAKTSVVGDMTIDRNALFSLVGGVDTLSIEPRGDVRCFGGSIRADQMLLGGAAADSTDISGRLLGVDALIDVDVTRVQGGILSLAQSSIVGDLSLEAQPGTTAVTSNVALSGRVLGNVNNAWGRLTSIGDLVVVGDLTNAQNSVVVARIGVVYVTGNVTNSGHIYGEVGQDPGSYTGGGTQPGDGIRVAGSLVLDAGADLSFTAPLWQFSVCGDVSLACAADSVRFDDAKFFLEGCNGTAQTFEATSANLGCVAGPFGGEQSGVSLIGNLELGADSTVILVDNFNNAPGSGAEVVYAKKLNVPAGATLITNGIKVITREAAIHGNVDNASNICVVPNAPNADLNGDGRVNGIDLAIVLTYWGTNAQVADVDRDGLVTAADMSFVLSSWTN